MNKEYEQLLSDLDGLLTLNEKDKYVLDVILGVSLSVETSKPVWVMITAPPSSGKSELISLLGIEKPFHLLHNITDKFLFSGYVGAQGGYMKREVKEKGILIFPDFTTVLNMNSYKRNTVFNQLRTIYDGESSIGTGSSIGNVDKWKGKVAIIANVTQTIEKLKDRSSDLGDRFIYYSFDPKVTQDSLKTYDTTEIRNSLISKVKSHYTESVKRINDIELTKEQDKYLWNISELIGWSRTVVDRDGYKRDITFVHTPEKPVRLHKALRTLFICLLAIHSDEIRAKNIMLRVLDSSIPLLRLKIMKYLYKVGFASIEDIGNIDNVSANTIRRKVSDLLALEIVKSIIDPNDKEKKRDLFFLSEKFIELLKGVL